MSLNEHDVRRFFSKYTSMSNIKTDELPKCEQDIVDVQEMIESGEFAEQESDLDYYRKGLAYFFGIGEVRNDDAGLRYLKIAADAGNIDAMNMYGFACYHTSMNAKNEPEKQQWYEKQAVKWFKEAAVMGQTEAIFNLGVCMIEGHGTDIDEKGGMRYLETALKKGHPRAALYIEDYKARHGMGVKVKREGDKEEILKQISETMKEQAQKDGITQMYVMGLFNDIYMQKGYKWIKNPVLGWICSKDDGESYLVSENEIESLNL